MTPPEPEATIGEAGPFRASLGLSSDRSLGIGKLANRLRGWRAGPWPGSLSAELPASSNRPTRQARNVKAAPSERGQSA